MTYRTLVVSLNAVDRAEALLDVATAMARKNDAHLIGLYVIPALQVYPAVAMQITPEIIEAQRQYYQEQAEKVKGLFDEAVRREGVLSEWREVDASGSTIADVVIDHGRCADLVIASQADEESEYLADTELCERLLMETGRPILFVPAYGEFKTFGTSVALAWSGARESARATFDALPFLQAASNVHLLAVNPPENGDRAAVLAGSEIANTLARHGVKVETHHSAIDEITVGDEVLARISDFGVDLLVMGGYGHSRMREFVFGGVTRQVLQQMTVPVLMSH